MEYNFNEIEKKWQAYWAEHKTFKAEIKKDKPKFYVLDMFPYPSGAGLHVGHPLGYIASDIYSRYKRNKGFNVLHPMGYDAYGLPAEQYAIQTGTHPAVTTEKNIARYRQQLDQIGFSFDWDREVRTSDPQYYKWTQWTFIQLFHSYFNNETNKADKIETLVAKFEAEGNNNVNAATSQEEIFTAEDWKAKSEFEQQELLMNYRLAYLANTTVNWCPALGTVLANDEVKEGLSERGGHPVEKRMMKQWLLRITAYSQRLLDGLNTIDWSDSLKETQRNWIGRSEGASVDFEVKGVEEKIEVFTTRPDTLFGATYMVLAPEHELVSQITTDEQKAEVEEYVTWAKNRSERERMSEVKTVSGKFTGGYGINPLTGQEIPIWVADYVLMGYGTGAIMAVPAHDTRDFAFAKHFELPIVQVVSQEGEEPTDPATWEDSYDSKDGISINSGFLTGMKTKKAIKAAIHKVKEMGIGEGTINYRLRDAIFSRQRYWGEPFPVYYKDGMPQTLNEDQLPLELPEVDKYLPTESGEPPLARATNWKTEEGYQLETNTMPGFAGSSAYYYRYMDPNNQNEYFSKEAIDYWQNVDLYLGGDEHATGHLLYSRFWGMFLFDLGLTVKAEPFQKLINQGKIQGRSSFVYRVNGTNKYVSFGLRKEYQTTRLHVDISFVNNDVLDTEAFKAWRAEYADAEFILEDGKYVCGWEVEKMSKSKYNVQNPDDLIEKYGADTFRLYEMFLGPLESHKPWDTNGIEGVFRFMRKFWRLFHNEQNEFEVSDAEPTKAELKILHQTIKKVADDIERFSFNTTVSQFMICTNELTDLKCNKKAILEPLTILIASYAPHIAEELWQNFGHQESISEAEYPTFVAEHVAENNFSYPVSFNGKMRFKMELAVTMNPKQVEEAVLNSPEAEKWLQGKAPKKVIVVPKRIVNIVI
ncbi:MULTISPECIES: leucine--tRNA ligase [unclassified Lentimicrobium]|uniref:leucine--tRNA ligase n=1 Tax=unclassified Lentimicrobium TaxID=2677434 RepID=UPI0015534BBF|nr:MULTISPECIES: leucine--tRNA ligase [unclassified Lentimicrobium]NPD44732.1 leucine--tRNA ligase [Lentimicrobium sp. S6]NPD83412.1 leucine--tRNA ligase [Lentimicrobium sp. L6]